MSFIDTLCISVYICIFRVIISLQQWYCSSLFQVWTYVDDWQKKKLNFLFGMDFRLNNMHLKCRLVLFSFFFFFQKCYLHYCNIKSRL